jgi:hypothetical protein
MTRSHRIPTILSLLCGLLLGPGSRALAQDPLPDLIIAAIEPLLQSSSAELRGEAALAVATTREPRFYPPILEVAHDKEPAARHRAILALGYLQHPGSDVFLDRVLRKAPKDSLDRSLAALALGLLPDQPRVPALDRFFAELTSSSRKRYHDRLNCMLLGLLHEAHPSRLTVLGDLLQNASYRNRPVLELVLENLARMPTTLEPRVLVAMLRSTNPQVVAASLRVLARHRIELDDQGQARILKLADRPATPAVRTAALEVLTALRHPASFDVARELLAADDPELAAAGVRTMLNLGGSTLREPIENRILAAGDGEVQAAMFDAKAPPHSDGFVTACLKIAGDTSSGPVRRLRAAKVAAAAGWKEVTPIVVTLFLEAGTADELLCGAGQLTALDADLTNKIHPAKTLVDTELMPVRLGALLRAGHKQARGLLLSILADPATDAVTRIAVIRAYRLAYLPSLPAAARSLAPAGVQELLR